MNIVFFMQDTGAIFGAERATIDLAVGLRNAGDSVRFFLMAESRLAHREQALRKAIEAEGFPMAAFPVSGRISLRLARDIRREFVKIGGDVLHVIGYKANLHAWLSGVHPVVATVHGWLFRNDAKERFYDAIDRWCLRRCDRVICLSTYYEQQLLGAGVARERLTLIPSGLRAVPSSTDVEAQRQRKSHGVVFGMLGRFSEEKNHRMFLTAAVLVHREFPGARFRIAGQGHLESWLREHVRSLKLSESMDICGYVGVDEFMASIDVYVICSRIENLPYSILEAMAWSKPVIGTGVGGIPDLVADGISGRLVDPDRPEKLADAMREFATDPSICISMGDAGRKRLLQSFTLENCAAMHQNLYVSLNKKA